MRRSGLGQQASRLQWIAAAALGVAVGAWSAEVGNPIQKGEMAGYLLAPNEKVSETYDAGFSMYVAASLLLDQYPGQNPACAATHTPPVVPVFLLGAESRS